MMKNKSKDKKKSKGSKFRWLLLLTVVLGIGATVVYSMQPTEVFGSQVMQADIEETIEIDGYVSLEEEITIYSPNAGYIRNLEAKEGADVLLADFLLSVEDSNINLGAKTLDASLAEAKSMLSLAANDSSYAKDAYQKQKALYEAGATSEAIYQAALNAYRASGSAYTAAVARVNQIQLQRDSAVSTEENQDVTAPLAGRILGVLVQEEAYVGPGSPLVWIGNLETRIIEASVLVDDMDDLDKNDPVTLSANYLNEDLVGTIEWISPLAKTAFSTLGVEQKRVPLKIAFDLSQEILQPGYSLDCTIRTTSSMNTTVLDRKAVFSHNGDDFVYLIQDGQLEKREVQLGLEDLNRVEVLDGLSIGDWVVAAPGVDMEAGMKVKRIEE
jgi:HlyD family secretion protein